MKAMETSCWKTRWQHKHRNETVISFSGGNSAKQAKTSNRVKPMVEKNQLMEMLRNRTQTEWPQKPQFDWLGYDDAKKKLMTCTICIQQKKTNAKTPYPLNHYNPHTQAVNYLDLLPLYGKSVIIELLKYQDPGYLVIKKCWPISKYWWPLFQILMGHWPILTKF